MIHIDNSYLVVWTFPTEERTFVFDYKSREYQGEWKSYENETEDRFRMESYVWAEDWDQHIIGDYANGTFWELGKSYYDDGGEVRRCVRRTGEIDHGTAMRKQSLWYDFHVKRGVATSSVTDPKLMLRIKEDDKGWSDPIDVSLGAVGDFESVVRVRYPGIYRHRQLEITCTDAVEFVLNKIEENVEPLDS